MMFNYFGGDSFIIVQLALLVLGMADSYMCYRLFY